MALIKCVECGKEISDKANACIHCGCPTNKMKKNTAKEINKIWLIICIVVCLLTSIFCYFNTALNIDNVVIRVSSLNINVMGMLTLILGCSYIILLKNVSKNNLVLVIIINFLILMFNLLLSQGGLSMLFIICAIINALITFVAVKNDLSNSEINIKEYLLIPFAIIIALCINFISNNNYISNDYYYVDTTLTQNEQKVYDTLVNYYLSRAYNPQAVRVVSGNTLYGFKISGTNQVGATITNCISLMPANYREEDTCTSVHNDVSSDSEWYIDVSKINQKLNEYWKQRGF